MLKCWKERNLPINKKSTFVLVLNNKDMHQSVKKGVRAGIIFFAFLFISLWLGKNFMIRYYVDQKLNWMARQHQLSIHYSDLHIQGLNTLHVENLTVVPVNQDTLIRIGKLSLRFSLSDLLLKKIEIKGIEAANLHLDFIKKGATSNFDFLYHPTSSSGTTEKKEEELDYAARTKRTLDLLFNLLPANAALYQVCLTYSNQGDELKIEVPALTICDNRFITSIRSMENNQRSEWVCEGFLQNRDHKIAARLYAKEKSKITLPFLNYRWGAQIRFDTLSLELEELKNAKERQRLSGCMAVSGLTVYHKRISPDTVLVDRSTLSWQLNIGKNYLEIDSSTTISFNKLNFSPYIKIRKEGGWHFTASVNKQNFPANDLFVSLPGGLFTNLEGLEVSGTLSYHFLVDVDFTQLDSLLLESSLTSRNFQIIKYGNTDLRKMSEPFLYTAYEQGEPIRTFEIGENNPLYCPYSAISPYLPIAIMQSEDAGFFQHAGFIPSAIRESLILDLKERRFARGGSTLSMQLVKNVFLSRNKTIARKLEEMLIVWLIESNHLTSKERMFEVYLNLIEWGPSIYGVTEASHFYFAKDPAALTLSECIFLASIIPKPKHVRSCFDGVQLKEHYNEYFSLLLTRMLDRERITAEDAASAHPNLVKITGPAREYLLNR